MILPEQISAWANYRPAAPKWHMKPASPRKKQNHQSVFAC
jgi:hypothetical protein